MTIIKKKKKLRIRKSDNKCTKIVSLVSFKGGSEKKRTREDLLGKLVMLILEVGDSYTVCKKSISSTLLMCVLELQVTVSFMVFSTFHHKNR